MSYYIVLHGPLGSGKSTNAEKLATVLGAKQVMLDEVLRENNLDNAKENEGCISAENFMQALDIVLPTVKEELKSGRVVVFDGCFYHEKVMDYLKENLPSEGYVFTLKTSLEMCIERDKHREKTLGEMAARAVYGLVLPHEFGTVINSSGTLEETHQEILNYLPSSKIDTR